MPVVWRIDIRLGEGPDPPLVRSERVEGETEEAVLRALAARLSGEGNPEVCDGQEEVSAEAEFARGSHMPPLEMRAETSPQAVLLERYLRLELEVVIALVLGHFVCFACSLCVFVLWRRRCGGSMDDLCEL